MGDYLATPVKEKRSEEGENGKVCPLNLMTSNPDIIEYRLGTAYHPCKAGEGPWRMHT
jgi:hypothetical protein